MSTWGGGGGGGGGLVYKRRIMSTWGVSISEAHHE